MDTENNRQACTERKTGPNHVVPSWGKPGETSNWQRDVEADDLEEKCDSFIQKKNVWMRLNKRQKKRPPTHASKGKRQEKKEGRIWYEGREIIKQSERWWGQEKTIKEKRWRKTRKAKCDRAKNENVGTRRAEKWDSGNVWKYIRVYRRH